MAVLSSRAVYGLNGLALAVVRCLAERPGAKLGALADEFGVDRHTLARALTQSGTSFRRDAVILERALEMLAQHPDLTINKVARQFGYAPRAFRRFVRQKTGQSPGGLRQEQAALRDTSPALTKHAIGSA